MLVLDILGTYYGDANLDGVFNTSDFVLVFQVGKYEDDVPGNATWEGGRLGQRWRLRDGRHGHGLPGRGIQATAQIRHNPSNLITMSPATAAAVEADHAYSVSETRLRKRIVPPSDPTLPSLGTRRQVELFERNGCSDTIFQRELDDWLSPEASADDVAACSPTERTRRLK